MPVFYLNLPGPFRHTQTTMKLYFTLIVFSILSIAGIGQKTEKAPVKFGKISPEDFKSVYSIDSNAQAVVIADIGYSEFVGNNSGWFSLEFTRQVRIHILNKNAYDIANFSIPLYSVNNAEEEVQNLKGTTYNLENGKVVETKLDKNSVFKEKIDKRHVEKKFTMPNLKEGCIIEVEYRVKSDFLYNLQPWAFQDEYPVLWSEYEVGIPEFFSYIFLSQGYQPFYIRDSKNKTTNFRGTMSNGASSSDHFSVDAGVTNYRWVMKNVPALKTESYTSTTRNHIAKIDFQLSEYRYPLTPKSIMGTWKELNDVLMKDEEFGLPISKDNGFLSDEIPTRAKSIKENNLQKAKLIYEYVRDNYKCTDDYAKYMSQTLRNLVKVKNGNVADINLLLIAMLRYAGYKADPVILGLRSRGVTYPMYPIVDRFNYVIGRLEVDGNKYYLDAADPMLGFGKLDPLCYNGHARVINGGPEAIELNTDMLSETKFTSVFVINEKGKLSGSIQQTPGYVESTHCREQVKEKGKETLIGEIKKSFNADVDIDNFRVDSLNKKDEPLGIAYDFTIRHDGEDILYVNPMFGEAIQNNPFKSAQRFYPVEMPYTVDDTYILTLDAPEGYAIDELPKSMVLKLNEEGEGLFEYRVSESGGSISLRSRLQIKRTVFAPEEYELLREFFNMVVNKQNEQIVFKKKK
jgi:hypothetical protein